MSTWEITNRCGNVFLKWSNKLNFKHKIPLGLQKEINSIWMKYIRKLSLSIKYTYVYNIRPEKKNWHSILDIKKIDKDNKIILHKHKKNKHYSPFKNTKLKSCK